MINEENNDAINDPFKNSNDEENGSNRIANIKETKIEENNIIKQTRRRRYSLDHETTKKLTMISNWEEVDEEEMLEKIVHNHFDNIFLPQIIAK